MQQPAESRILTAMEKDHKETLTGISGLKDSIHNQDTRLCLVEVSQKDLLSAVSDIEKQVGPQAERLTKLEGNMKFFTDAAEIAAGERRDTKRLVKGSAIGILGLFLATGVFGYYGLKGNSNTAAAVAATALPVQEAKKQDDAISKKLDTLIDLQIQEAEQRKKQPDTVRSPRRGQGRSPEPIPGPNGPGASLRDGELRANDKVWDTYASLRYLSGSEARP